VNDIERGLWQTLLELDRRVKTLSASGGQPGLQPLFAELDDLTRRLPPQTAPELLHYLHKKSYTKARLFLEGRDAENAAGNCGHQ
jgi:hypothetical protein